MATKTSDLPKTYFDLVHELPLIHLTNGYQHDVALKMMERLLSIKGLDKGGRQYLDALTDLIMTYEDTNHPIPAVSEAHVLQSLVEANSLTQADLARSLGVTQSTISKILRDKRGLTKSQIARLCHMFKLTASAFIQPSP